MSFIIHSQARALGIHNPVACIIHNVKIDNNFSNNLSDIINELMEKVKTNSQSFQETPQASGFREIFTRMGYPKQLPAGQRLFNTFSDKGFKRYNNVIDACNIVGIENVAGLGLHNAKKFIENNHTLHLWRALGTEKIVPSFRNKEEKIRANDLVYGVKDDNQSDVMAWLGKQDKDSDPWKIVDDVTSLLFVVLGNEHTTEDYNRNVCERFLELIKISCQEAKLEMLTTQHIN